GEILDILRVEKELRAVGAGIAVSGGRGAVGVLLRHDAMLLENAGRDGWRGSMRRTVPFGTVIPVRHRMKPQCVTMASLAHSGCAAISARNASQRRPSAASLSSSSGHQI